MKRKYTFVVLTNAEQDREDEFNDWYTDQHLGDVLKISGIVAAQRFRLAEVQRSAEPPSYQYLALYEIETDDLQSVLNELTARSGTRLMPVSDAMMEEKFAYVFEPIAARRQTGL